MSAVPFHGIVQHSDWTPYGQPLRGVRVLLILLGGGLSSVAVADVGPRICRGHTNVISAVTFAADGRRVITASWDKTLRVWDARSGAALATLTGHRDWVFAVAAAPDGRRLVSASQHAVRVWNAKTYQPVHTHEGLGGATVNTVALSPDARRVATGGRQGNLRVWSLESQALDALHTFGGFESWVTRVSISADNQIVAAAARDGRLRLFDLTKGRERKPAVPQAGQPILSLAFSPLGDSLATGGHDRIVRLWNPENSARVSQFPAHKGIVTAVAWSADGQRLASGERHGHIKLWDTTRPEPLVLTLAGHADDRLGFSVTALAFSPDGQHLASAAYDKTLKLWDLPDK
ncbi:MAG: WD40 repeat domain-containing protein [Planctomycetaceae bacterium]